MATDNDGWALFSHELAKKLRPYKNKNKRSELVNIVKGVYKTPEVKGAGIKMPPIQAGKKFVNIDPFTVFSLFFRKGGASVTDKSTKTYKKTMIILRAIAKAFSVPEQLIPTDFDDIPFLQETNANFCHEASTKQIEALWELFGSALDYADDPSSRNKEAVSKYFDIAIGIKNNAFKKVSIGLHWIAPDVFLNLDGKIQEYICKSEEIPAEIRQKVLELQKEAKKNNARIPAQKYFDLLDGLKECLSTTSLKDSRGLSLVAYSTYTKDSKDKPKPNTEGKVNVKPNTPWVDPFQDPKPNPFQGLLEKPSQNQDKMEDYSVDEFLDEVYLGKGETKEEADVDGKKKYDTLVRLLKNRKNIILQGPPGVGKTFAARRLAYAMMGKKDNSRIKLVQFHQNYSYEDFVEGYKPRNKKDPEEAKEEGEFVLRKGTFYDFCKKARGKEEPYFFIIDEINRGNMSKIFGELLMLIEKDYRGDKYSLELAYSREKFSVPENVFIIGMMNTADRSLAMLDYALRRRFAFINMEPAFDAWQFKEQNKKFLENPNFNALIEWVQDLNKKVIAEDPSLGSGFCIGHSYFCGWYENDDLLQKMRDVVDCDILPTLREYWFENKEVFKKWETELRNVIS